MTSISLILTLGGFQPFPVSRPQFNQSIAPFGPVVLVTSSVAPDLPHVESVNEYRPTPPRLSLPDVMGEMVSVLGEDEDDDEPVDLACEAEEDDDELNVGAVHSWVADEDEDFPCS